TDAANAREIALKKAESALQEKNAADRLRETTSKWQSALALWEEGNVISASNKLMTIPVAMRNWEWDLLRNMQHSAKITMFEHGGKKRSCVAYSPDGEVFAYLDAAKIVTIRAGKTGNFRKRLEGHAQQINCLA